jgi:hypothetical protein
MISGTNGPNGKPLAEGVEFDNPDNTLHRAVLPCFTACGHDGAEQNRLAGYRAGEHSRRDFAFARRVWKLDG